ncbi:hypothetical protein QQ045_017224 [Rhodiola kirilowii]
MASALCGPSLCLAGGEMLYTNRRSVGGGVRSVELSSSFVESWEDWRKSGSVMAINCGVSLMRRKRGRRSSVIVSELAGQYEDSFEDVKAVISCTLQAGLYTNSEKSHVCVCVFFLQQMLNYFTYKAVRTVMNQLYEMNPTEYRWLYEYVLLVFSAFLMLNLFLSVSEYRCLMQLFDSFVFFGFNSFVVNNKPGDGKRFLRTLGKERHELAERVMVTRLHLYGKWIKVP